VGTKKNGKLQIYKLEKVMKDLDDFYLLLLLLFFGVLQNNQIRPNLNCFDMNSSADSLKLWARFIIEGKRVV
jgi:hypothetical protein